MKPTLFFSGIAPLWPVKLLLSLILIVGACLHVFQRELPMARILTANMLILTGAFLELWHYRLLKRGAGALGAPAQLVTRGGFLRVIRHPMYLGDVVMLFGFALLMSHPVGWGVFALFVGVVLGLCAQEDQAMAKQFPEAFAEWRKHTWRVLPGIV